ncbi:cysteine hydrolase family protein [Pusillimonas noertemannii]|uniref:cysteine hydrolase family protein n=1 Tax=Pusillimonas noertemannii TaxID=305977 RepID=UPI00352C820D
MGGADRRPDRTRPARLRRDQAALFGLLQHRSRSHPQGPAGRHPGRDGVVTNICVRSTVHDAFFLGYRVVVPQDCVAATGPREQASSLYDIATHFGVVSTADSTMAALSSGSPVEVLNCE